MRSTVEVTGLKVMRTSGESMRTLICELEPQFICLAQLCAQLAQALTPLHEED